MASSVRRSVITGLGILSPIGCDPATFWSSFVERRSGIRGIQSIDASELSCRIAGEIPDFDARKFLTEKEPRKQLRVMARTVQLGVSAAQRSWEASGLKKGSIDPTRFGVEFGAGMIATELDDIGRASRISTNCAPGAVSLETWGKSIGEIPPLWMLKYLPNMPACHVSIMFDAQGPNNTITESDVASLLALGEARRVIERDLADFFLVGGTESKLNPLSLTRHNLFQPLSKRNDSPAQALRPFDRDRDGTVLAEGAAVFAVEELEHAKKRGANILAEVVGFASGFDRLKDGRVLAKVIRRALTEANITPADIDHVNAFGLGTKESDVWEAKAIREVFGRDTPVWAPKANFGSSGAAGGLLELAASILALHHGQLPPTLNFENADAECLVAVHANNIRPTRTPYALKISLTDFGQNAVAVIKAVQ